MIPSERPSSRNREAYRGVPGSALNRVERNPMRALLLLCLAAPLALTACGGTDRETKVIVPSSGTTVVVPETHSRTSETTTTTTKTCPAGYSVC